MRATSWIIMLGLALAIMPGCRPAASKAPDAGGPRIAALAPAVAIILRDLGLGDRIVARHGRDESSDPSLPIGGDQEGIDYEALIKARPTHVVLQWGERPMPTRLMDLALRNRWEVRNLPLLTLDDIRSAIVTLGEMFTPKDPVPGFEKTGLDRLIPAFDRAFAQRGGMDPSRVGRVLLLYGTSPPSALGPGSYHHQTLERLGATPALTQGSPFVPMDAEDVLRLKPDAIVLIQPREATAAPFPTPRNAASLRDRLGRLAGLDIPAVTRGRVALIDDPRSLIPGSNLIDFANELGEILSAWSMEGLPVGVGGKP